MTITAPDPRIARSRAAVLDATVALLGEVGHSGTTIEAIAERSGVAKTTIYRHWPNRAQLLVEAFDCAIDTIDVPDTGDLRADLVAVAESLATKLRDPAWSRLLVTLIDAAQCDEELAALSREFSHARRRVAQTVVERAIARGELDARVDADLVTQLVGGFLFYRRLILSDPADHDLVERAIDAVLVGARGRS
jgi:AcrR family transcriptional regulator